MKQRTVAIGFEQNRATTMRYLIKGDHRKFAGIVVNGYGFTEEAQDEFYHLLEDNSLTTVIDSDPEAKRLVQKGAHLISFAIIRG